tara:strand:- start:1040 stop:1315 length:276 start_codon:yes stop_codon:yes gene_type:complete
MQGVNNKRTRAFYVIINVKWNWKKPIASWAKPYLKHLDFNLINENSDKSLRYNKDKTKAIISIATKPDFVKDKRILTHEQITNELRKEEWK